ncbi:F-box/LRR-repeat protein 2-like [Aphidius gifuensis]|uniref:F-box/LRR-repeat protein 2-like n=1 Tax=Aphidius gifuensis TaxID=684658 RepID=UPI001CDC83D9|nr:F-box/LRR-repeat protein 2-like [Aphidius gifuensis]
MNLREITTLVYLKIGLYDDHVQRNFSLFNKLINLEYIDLMMNMMDYKGEEMVNFSTKLLNTIFSTCKNLKHLDITPGPYNVAKIPFEKWINFQNLQHLGISCLLMPDLANTIVKYCKNLKHLRIHNLQRDINDTALKKLTELENLESLILDRLIELYEESIIAISNNCKKLKRLEIFGCIILSSINNIENCRAITETALVGLTNLKKLQKLNVTFLDISDSIIIELKGLKELDCAYCQKLTDSGIIQFIKNNPDLEFLNVCSIDNITTDLVIAANQATKNRTNGIILHIRISDQSILQAAKSIIKSQCSIVPSIHTEPLSSPFVLDELSKLQCLEHLNLCYVKNLNDSTITAIANNCKNLKSLDIESCKAITETALVGLTNLKNLQKLNVSYLDTITDSFLIKLKGLKELDCSYCKKLTNSGIIQFIKNNPDLKKIDVYDLDGNITSDMVISADQATKNRTNGIILHIRTSDPAILQASKSIIKSQWLAIDSI